MSTSLLQSPGRIQDGKVEIFLQRVDPHYHDEEPIKCPKCGSLHGQLYRIWRKPADTIGCWVCFRIAGEMIPADLSVPLSVGPTHAPVNMPRDAEKLTEEEAVRYWHST